MLTINQCKEILKGECETNSNEQISQLKEILYKIGEIAYETVEKGEARKDSRSLIREGLD
jgi:hypothetical protein